MTYNDGDSAQIASTGNEGIGGNPWLNMVQIHRQDVRNTIEEFRGRFPVGMRINISTTTEIVNESSETLTGVASFVTSHGSPIQTDLKKSSILFAVHI